MSLPASEIAAGVGNSPTTSLGRDDHPRGIPNNLRPVGHSMPRVLSLLSASTEIVHRLGCSDMLVGRSHGCDDPALATTLPIATAPKVDPNASSLELDKAVRAQAVSGGPIYDIKSTLITTLKPDVIITQEQCRICAVTPSDVAAACRNLPATVKLVTIMPTTLDDVLGDVTTIASALGVPERGARLVSMIRARLTALTAITSAVVASAPAGRAPRVAHLEWLAPVMGSGYWIAECMEAAGCTMVHGTRGGHSQTIESLNALADADVILLAPCGFSIERTHAELGALKLLESAEWKALPAVRRGAVAVADGNLYFNRSSCGVLESAEIVAEVCHDELRGLLGHHGCRWVRLHELEAFCAREGAPPPTKRVEVATADVEGKPVLPAKLTAKRPAADLSPHDGIELPATHVQRQVALLRARDFDGAYAMNSEANRARLTSADKFKAVVESNASFAALADPANAFQALEEGYANGRYVIEVRVQTVAQGQLVFAFDVVEGLPKAGYATEGVRIVC